VRGLTPPTAVQGMQSATTEGVKGVRMLLSSMWTAEARAEGAGSSKEAGTPQSADACSLGSTPSSEPEVSATGAEAATPQQSSPPAPEESTISDARRSSIRRNYTASAALSQQGGEPFGLQAVRRPSAPNNSSPGMRRNTSAATLCELRRREESAMSKSDASLQGSRASVVEAVACRMLELILGQDAALSAMRLALAAAAAAAASPTDESSLVSPPAAAPSAQIGGASGSGSSSAGSSSSSSLADDEMRLSALRVPTNISTSVQGYILTIVRHLELPNSCIVAALIYVQRAVVGTKFTLTVTNWQPCLLAAFVIAAKLSFDEPVWNEDFVKALRISNVQVCQISRWEADFLQLLSFNTNVTVAQYASCCFALQRAYESVHSKPCRFFTYLMELHSPASNAPADD